MPTFMIMGTYNWEPARVLQRPSRRWIFRMKDYASGAASHDLRPDDQATTPVSPPKKVVTRLSVVERCYTEVPLSLLEEPLLFRRPYSRPGPAHALIHRHCTSSGGLKAVLTLEAYAAIARKVQLENSVPIYLYDR
jgi:hypothetical protein